jgi:hypothetical protein
MNRRSVYNPGKIQNGTKLKIESKKIADIENPNLGVVGND